MKDVEMNSTADVIEKHVDMFGELCIECGKSEIEKKKDGYRIALHLMVNLGIHEFMYKTQEDLKQVKGIMRSSNG